MKKLKMMLAIGVAFCLMSLVAVGSFQMAHAQNIPGSVNCGIGVEPGTNCPPSNPGDTSLTDVIKNIINIFSWIVGVVSVIMIIYGGFRYITSAGNDVNVANAKNTILYAIIGLVVVALAQVIVRFVMSSVS